MTLDSCSLCFVLVSGFWFLVFDLCLCIMSSVSCFVFPCPHVSFKCLLCSFLCLSVFSSMPHYLTCWSTSPVPHLVVRVDYFWSSCHFQQAYAPGPYGDYAAPPPHATQIVYSADGQPYAVAYPYQYQGK